MARLLANLEVLDHNIGALSGMTYGTMAAIVKCSTLTGSRTMLGLHTSGAVGRQGYNIDGQTIGYWNGGNYRQSGNIITSTSTWYLIVTRKATGSVIARTSVLDLSTGTWTHAAISTAISDATAPGAGGFAEWRYEASEYWQGDIAVRAAWSNLLPWTADAAGDALIEAQGLQYSLSSWHAASPHALWVYDQADVAQAVPDMAGGGATQSSISGTLVSGTSVPGFGYGGDILEILSAPSGGPSASGVGATDQRTATAEAGLKAAAGSGTAVAYGTTAEVGLKSSAAGTSSLTRSRTVAAGAKAATGVAVSGVRAVTSCTGVKGAASTAGSAQETQTTSAGTKASSGAGATPVRSLTVAGSSVGGAGRAVQRSATSATGVRGAAGSGTTVSRATGAAAGRKGGQAAGSSVAHCTAAGAGRKGGSAAGVSIARSTGLSAGKRATSGASATTCRSAVVGAGRRSAAGAGVSSCRAVSLAAGSSTPIPSRDLTLTGSIAPGRFSGTIAPGRFSGTLAPGRLKGKVIW